MKHLDYKKALPYATAILLFFVVSLAYFPEILQGKKLAQHDKKTWKGGAKEVLDHREKTGKPTLWTNSMFGGMPSYLVSNHNPGNKTNYLFYLMHSYKLRPASFLFLAMFGFFIALLLFGVNPWLSIAGAIAYGFSTYYPIIIEAGHLTKMLAVGLMPPIIAGIYHAYRKNALIGSVVTMIFLTLQITVNHLQITYYTFLIVLIYMIFEGISFVKEKRIKDLIKPSMFLLLAAVIALTVNFSQLYTVYDYGKDSIRGKSELTQSKNDNKTTGLDKDYVTAWSYGKLETFNLLIPDLVGGASGSALPEDSHMANTLKDLGVRDTEQIVKHMPTYWGAQPFTSGPVYVGAVIVFLFVLGLLLVKGRLKWWLLATTILAILLAWGKNFMFFTDFFLDYVPGYNKFRTVSMILVIAQFTLPLLGILAVKQIMEEKVNHVQALRALKISLGIVGGLILIFLINPGILSFSSPNDILVFSRSFGLKQDPQSKQILQKLIEAIEADRASLFRADAVRSLLFVMLTGVCLFLLIKKMVKPGVFVALLSLLILVDLWGVDKRFLNEEDFVTASNEKTPFVATEADKFILKDKEMYYRVLNLTVSPFNDASTSWFHKSVGGYHGAKMRRYQELIDRCLQREIGIFSYSLNNSLTPLQMNQTLQSLSVLNMLNTKYIIIDRNSLPVMNPFKRGNAWFVNRIKEVNNADEELEAVTNFNPERTAVIDKRFKDQFFPFRKDSTATIQLTKYAPDELEYRTSTNTDQLAVFSDIYYEKGWKAFVDGKPVSHMRADYVLRAMKIPAGVHTVRFSFDPKMWHTAHTISLIGSVLFYLILLGGIFLAVKKYRKQQVTEEANRT